ncbi:hypothetical protein NQ318_022510 [Aromia moschata]|uniref:Uncharacterized protein n=1 Tax=Aromia moschata TaxID=1265417 RepID=A0AAV8Z6T4_9CUCU|nr:hypothetical protein NQ318_022510 [Aromia moschata]
MPTGPCFRSAPASPSHVSMSDLMTPECLSREGSPTMDHMVDASQSAPGSPGNPSVAYAGSGGMIGHQQMSALVGANKARLLLSHPMESMDQGASSNGQEYREGRGVGMLEWSSQQQQQFEKYHVNSNMEERSLSPAAFSPQPVIVQTANYSPYREGTKYRFEIFQAIDLCRSGNYGNVGLDLKRHLEEQSIGSSLQLWREPGRPAGAGHEEAEAGTAQVRDGIRSRRRDGLSSFMRYIHNDA